MIDLLGDLSTYLGEENIFQGQLPDEPDNVILLNYAAGLPPTRFFGNVCSHIEYPRFVLKVRDNSYENGYSKIYFVNNKIISCKSIPYVRQFNISGTISTLGRDNRNRYEFLAMYTTIISYKF